MTAQDTALAVVLRSMQWKLDEAAFATGARGLARSECAELLNDLGDLAVAVAMYADKTPRVVETGAAAWPQSVDDRRLPE